MAMRMDEYKIHVKVLQTHAQWLDIDMSTRADVGLAPWLFNLYIDPKEQYPVGHRMNAWLASLAAEMRAHAATHGQDLLYSSGEFRRLTSTHPEAIACHWP
jgi:arylsulfatase